MLENIEISKTQGQAPTKTDPLDWKNSSSAKRLLDVISAILAKEYIETAIKNPEVFLEIASPPSGVHNQTVL